MTPENSQDRNPRSGYALLQTQEDSQDMRLTAACRTPRSGYALLQAPCRYRLQPVRSSGARRSGYALLFIYMMAAVIGIMLYMAVPRVAFESQRDREQLLIDRGEQYKRAVQLYVRKFNRFPVDIAALENTQNIRFLRKQYVDPMTGKNEWRLIHVGPGGAFTDSLVYGQQQKKDATSGPQTFIATVNEFNTNQTGQQGVNLATRRRPSDDPGAPGSDPGNPGSGSGSGPVMVLPDGRIVPATSTGVPAPTGAPPAPGQPPPQFAGNYGQPGSPIQPGATPPGFQSQPNNTATQGNAANLINQILTTPRPGGLNGQGGFTPSDPTQANTGGVFGGAINGTAPAGNTGVSAGTGLGGTVVGGGIAGVASKQEQEGIKLYNERSSYNEWEFVYDMSKDTSRTGGANAVPNSNMGQQQGNGSALGGSSLLGNSGNQSSQSSSTSSSPVTKP